LQAGGQRFDPAQLHQVKAPQAPTTSPRQARPQADAESGNGCAAKRVRLGAGKGTLVQAPTTSPRQARPPGRRRERQWLRGKALYHHLRESLVLRGFCLACST
tara:strand:- start:804 stop:1112 length:309 start_codon:yes stop_codon:yes gene_type:complete